MRGRLSVCMMPALVAWIAVAGCSGPDPGGVDTAAAEEAKPARTPPPDLDVEPGGGGGGVPPLTTTSGLPVKWSFGGKPAVVGPPAKDLIGTAKPAINDQVLKHKVKESRGYKKKSDTGFRDVKEYRLTVDSYCGGRHTIRVQLDKGKEAVWLLDGETLVERDAGKDEHQLPCEFFGVLVGDIEVTTASNKIEKVERARIKWK